MNVLDRYILREWLKIFGLILTATLGLLVIQDLYNSFRGLLEDGATVFDIVRYYLTSMPSYLSVVLPLSLLISLLFSLGKLHRHNEFTAMRAAGLSIFRITRMIWVVGIVFCGVNWYLNAHVIPRAVEKSTQIMEQLHFSHEAKSIGSKAGMVYSVAFDNQRQNRLWFINRYSRLTQRAYGVTVSEMGSHRRERTRVMAREAWFDEQQRNWVFADGRELWFDPETGDNTHSEPFAERRYKEINDDPELLLIMDRKPEDLSLFQLRQIVDYFSVDENPKVTRYALRYYSIIADTLGCLIIIGIAIPFAVSGVRVSPAVGVSKSVGLFFAYYILVSFSSILGGDNVIDPIIAAWVPNLTMLGVGLLLMVRLR